MIKAVPKIVICYVILFGLVTGSALADSTMLLEKAPEWRIGDTWKFKTDKKLDRTVVQSVGFFSISTHLRRVTGTTTYEVASRALINGAECYVTKVSGDQQIVGTYSTNPVPHELMTGDIIQKSTFEGVECRRVTDLAFVKTELQSKGTVELGGDLGGFPTPFNNFSITTANPPVQMFKFPLLKNDTWIVSSVLNTVTSGAQSDSVVTTYNYNCKVIGNEDARLENGDSFDSIAISQQGTQTVQSENFGISIEEVNGNIFFAPLVGNRVRDDAEGEEMIEYTRGEEP